MDRLTPLKVIMNGLKNGAAKIEWDDALIDHHEVKEVAQFEEEMREQFGTEWHEDDMKPEWKDEDGVPI